MNKLSIDRQAQIIKVLCEGNSIRSTARITDSSINTVVKLLREVGKACLEYQDKVMRNLNYNVMKSGASFIQKIRMFQNLIRVSLVMVMFGLLPLLMRIQS
jgi:hypothetical protein